MANEESQNEDKYLVYRKLEMWKEKKEKNDDDNDDEVEVEMEHEM